MSAPVAKSLALAAEERLRRALSSGAVKAYQGGPAPKFRDRRGTRNRGKGAAIKWLCEHADFREAGCLYWPFAKDHGHPGCVGYCGRIYRASRLMCVLAHGEPPSDRHHASCICGHSHEGCINPRHLRWKTQSQNQTDQAKNGRPFYGKGGKLTPAQAAEIRAIGDKMKRFEVAKLYEISVRRVTGLLRGEGFLRPRKPWSFVDGRYYARIGYNGLKFSLGGHPTAQLASAAYEAALEGLRHGELPTVNRRPRYIDENPESVVGRPQTAFGDGVEFGQRVIAVDPTQEHSLFQLFAALEKLDHRVKKFVIAVTECGEIEEAAANVGFDRQTLALLLPRLRVFLEPYLRG